MNVRKEETNQPHGDFLALPQPQMTENVNTLNGKESIRGLPAWHSHTWWAVRENACQRSAVTPRAEATGGGHPREQKGDPDAHRHRDAVAGILSC